MDYSLPTPALARDTLAVVTCIYSGLQALTNFENNNNQRDQISYKMVFAKTQHKRQNS